MKYWRECVEDAFDEAGLVATDEQIELIVDAVEGAHETYGMAFGHDCIPNPRDADIERLEAKLKAMEQERDKTELNFKKNVAMRRKCNVSDVSIGSDGHVTIY